MHRDAVDPGLQAALPVEVTDPPEHFQEHFLKHVCGVRVVFHNVRDQVENSILIQLQQVAEGLLRARLQLLNE